MKRCDRITEIQEDCRRLANVETGEKETPLGEKETPLGEKETKLAKSEFRWRICFIPARWEIRVANDRTEFAVAGTASLSACTGHCG